MHFRKMFYLFLVVLVLFSPLHSAPVKMATHIPKTGMGAVWTAIQRVLATYPKKDVEEQLRQLQTNIDEEAWRQFKVKHPNAQRPSPALPVFFNGKR